jgi:15-cis-phytoene synthase
LFALDARFAQIVRTTSESMIGLMRLAWWREALERLDGSTPPAEPLLRSIAAELLPLGITGAQLSEIEDGWAALLDGETDAPAIARHAARGGHLFAAAAQVLGAEMTLEGAGRLWALAGLANGRADPQVRAEAARQGATITLPARWSKHARPLGMLGALARTDVRSTGRQQGHPARLLRMLALRLTGR